MRGGAVILDYAEFYTIWKQCIQQIEMAMQQGYDASTWETKLGQLVKDNPEHSTKADIQLKEETDKITKKTKEEEKEKKRLKDEEWSPYPKAKGLLKF
jgi:hypothetical protein